MYRTLFDLAGLAIFAWLLLMLLPTWRVTRWLAETAVFPVFLSALYAVTGGAKAPTMRPSRGPARAAGGVKRASV